MKNLLKNTLSILTIFSITACATSNDLSLQENLSENTTISSLKTKRVFGAKLSGKNLISFDVPDGNNFGKKVDLRKFSSTPVNQDELGACTGFAIAKGLREYFLRKDSGDKTALSPLFLYYNERKIENTIDEDAGAIIETGMKVLKNIGVSSEDAWPYIIKNFKLEPSLIAYENAKKYKVKKIRELKGLRQIKIELDKGNPVVFGIEVYSSFEEPKNGIVPIPDRKKEEHLGGHAVVCLGYDDTKGHLIMKNSWGTDWGDKGYFYLPYEFFKLKLAEDAWTADSK